MNSKKAITLLVLATLVMSIVPILPVSAAVDVEGTWATDGSAADLTGDYGDTIMVNGTGITSGASVELYWDTVSAAGLLNTTTGSPDGSYEVWFDVPSDTGGDHYLWVKDLQTGDTDWFATPFVVVPRITLSEDEGLAGDEITVTGYGFAAEKVMNITFGPGGAPVVMDTNPTEIETTEDGYFTATFDIPVATGDGAYVVIGIDNATGLVSDDNAFTVGAAITLDVDEGPAGTVVEITGRGFTASVTDLNETDVTILGGWPVPIEDDDEFDISSSGTFTQKFIIPSVAVGDITITVDDGTKTATADFEVLGVTELEVDPEYAAPGASITVSGYNFSQISGSTLTFTVGGSSASDSITVDADGTFEGTLTMPALTLGEEHAIVAIDENGLNATVNILSGVLTVLLSDYEGSVGTEISLTATGLKGTLDYNVTIGDEQLISAAVGGVTAISDTFLIPSLTTGVHTLTFEDEGWDISVDVDITVTDVATLTLTPSAGAPDNYNVTIYGVNFAEEDGLALTWMLSNVTDSWDISADILTTGAAATTDDDGIIDAYWNVSAGAVDVLEIGEYLLNVTMDPSANHVDAPAIWAEIVFNVVAEEWDISIKKDSYTVGDTITYNIRATFPKEDAELTITDPDGYTYWFATLGAGDWVTVGDWETVPVGYQVGDNSAAPFTLSEDAPLGTWTWAIEDDGGDELESGSFEVVEPADSAAAVEAAVEVAIEAALEESLASVTADIEALADEIVDYSGEFSSLEDDIAAVASAAADAVDAAEAAADAVASVATVAGDAAEAAADAAEAATAAKDAATGLTTLVYGAIGAALVAALAAIVSLMQISRRIAG